MKNKISISILIQIITLILPLIEYLAIYILYGKFYDYLPPLFFMSLAVILPLILLVLSILLIKENRKYKLYSIIMINPLIYIINLLFTLYIYLLFSLH